MNYNTTECPISEAARPIASELAEQGTAIDRLRVISDQLCQKLDPILEQSRPELAAGEKKSPISGDSPLVTSLRSNNQNLFSLAQQLDYLIRRIEL